MFFINNKEIQEWMNKNDIKFDVTFVVYDIVKEILYFCKINKLYEFKLHDGYNNCWIESDFITEIIKNDLRFKVGEEPYLPSCYSSFYYIGSNLDVSVCNKMNSLTDFEKEFRKILCSLGNCYKTKEEAEKFKKYWRKQYWIPYSKDWTLGKIHIER